MAGQRARALRTRNTAEGAVAAGASIGRMKQQNRAQALNALQSGISGFVRGQQVQDQQEQQQNQFEEGIRQRELDRTQRERERAAINNRANMQSALALLNYQQGKLESIQKRRQEAQSNAMLGREYGEDTSQFDQVLEQLGSEESALKASMGPIEQQIRLGMRPQQPAPARGGT